MDKPPPPKPTATPSRQQKLGAALKRNMARRKQAAQSKQAAPAPSRGARQA